MTSRAIFPNRPTRGLVALAQRALGMTHREFGEALGVSERTSLRMAAGRSSVTVEQLRTLARLVHPRDADLASELADAASESLESLGIATAAASPLAPAAPVVTDPAILVDLVVCAAADAAAIVPGAARAALLAALARARELGMSAESVEKALAVRGKEPQASAPLSPR